MPLDPKVKAMLAAMRELDPRPLESLSVAEARQRALAMRNPNAVMAPVGSVEDRTIAGPGGDLRLRIYAPEHARNAPVMVYMHGGGYVLCNLDTHDLICRELCHHSGCIVVSVDYRLAPEHRFPAATDDCLAAVRWAGGNAAALGGDPDRIAVAGDSCGGNLATVTALRIRDEGGPGLGAQILLCPITDYYDPPTQSYLDNAEDYFLTRNAMIWFLDHYLNDRGEADNPHVSPLRCPDLAGLPPAYIIAAQYDPLRDEAAQYARRLEEAGVATVYECYPGMIHAFYGQIGVLDQARRSIQACADWLKRTLSA